MWKLTDTGGNDAPFNMLYKDRLGDFHILLSGEPPHKPSSTGRVTTDQGTFYPSVIGLKWTLVPLRHKPISANAALTRIRNANLNLYACWAMSDKDLLSHPTIGRKTLAYIRSTAEAAFYNYVDIEEEAE